MANFDVHRRPVSATPQIVGLSGLVTFAIAAYWLKDQAAINPALTLAEVVGAMILVMGVLELAVFKRYKDPATGLDFTAQNANHRDLGRIGIKLAGYCGTLAILAFFYWLLPVYHDEVFRRSWSVLTLVWVWPLLLILPFPYFYWLDRYMKQPCDGYYQAGLLFTTLSFKEVDLAALKGFARGWLVKGFFVPLMVGYLVHSFEWFGHAPLHFEDFTKVYPFAYDAIFFVDLVMCVAGYIVTVRILDSQIKSAEPTLLGWAVALACYQPFYDGVTSRYLRYEDGYFWGEHFNFQQNPTMYTIWGSIILLLIMIYSWATVSFGFRFSNLTYRGIITSGPYRFTKHPAYVAKNLSWWLISVPFFAKPGSPSGTAISCSLLLLGLNGIYFLRARTEEQHLSMDPNYVAYAEWINEHGVFSWLGRMFPFFKYKRPTIK